MAVCTLTVGALLSTSLRCIDVNFRVNKAVIQLTIVTGKDDDVEVLVVAMTRKHA
jgi:hypothetical protein